MVKNLKQKFSNDSGAIVSAEIIFGVTLAVVVSLSVGPLLRNQIQAKAEQTAQCIENANAIFSGGQAANNCVGN